MRLTRNNLEKILRTYNSGWDARVFSGKELGYINGFIIKGSVHSVTLEQLIENFDCYLKEDKLRFY